MRFSPTELNGAWLIDLDPVCDNRGHFVRTFCVDEFASHKFEINFPQHSSAYSRKKGTIRGMHFQRAPHSEVKLVRCVRGSIWDVIIDIRPESPTYLDWQEFELSNANGRQLYVPAGFAHGYQTLCDDVEVNYLISARYVPGAASGVRYDDPLFSIDWPLALTEISEKDLTYPPFRN